MKDLPNTPRVSKLDYVPTYSAKAADELINTLEAVTVHYTQGLTEAIRNLIIISMKLGHIKQTIMESTEYKNDKAEAHHLVERLNVNQARIDLALSAYGSQIENESRGRSQ